MMGDGGRFGWSAREGREQWLEMASLAPAWPSGLPERLSMSIWGDGWEDGWLHWPTWPLGSPATHCLLHQSLKGDCPCFERELQSAPSHVYTSFLCIILLTVLKATHIFPCLCLVSQPLHLILPDLLAGQDQTPFSCLIHRLLLTLLYMNASP